MAELEVAKAAKKIVKTAKSKEHGIWHKIKEMTTEIVIIVFAVSLSIAFHSWSESRHEQHEVKTFLKGLRQDLRKDIEGMKSDIVSYQNQKKAFSYFAAIPKEQAANEDSLKAYSPYFFSSTALRRNTGRYEGFKSSGKIGYMEDDSLQNDILDLYEEHIPVLTTLTDSYTAQKNKFAEYITENTMDYPKGNLTQVLASDPIKNRSRIYLVSVDNIIVNYQKSIQLMEKIIRKVDKEVPHTNH